jgi:hypothetical protein
VTSIGPNPSYISGRTGDVGSLNNNRTTFQVHLEKAGHAAFSLMHPK